MKRARIVWSDKECSCAAKGHRVVAVETDGDERFTMENLDGHDAMGTERWREIHSDDLSHALWLLMRALNAAKSADNEAVWQVLDSVLQGRPPDGR